MADHRAPVRDTANPTLAVVSLLLGVAGVAGAWWPWFNHVTLFGAMLGAMLGAVGIWHSRQVLSGLGAVLCATAVMVTVAVQQAEPEARAARQIELTSSSCR